MAYTKFHREIDRIIRPFGLHIDIRGHRHFAILNSEGKRVGTIAKTPSDNPKHVIENTCKQPIAKGAMDKKAYLTWKGR